MSSLKQLLNYKIDMTHLNFYINFSVDFYNTLIQIYRKPNYQQLVRISQLRQNSKNISKICKLTFLTSFYSRRNMPEQYWYQRIDLDEYYQSVNGLNSIGGTNSNTWKFLSHAYSFKKYTPLYDLFEKIWRRNSDLVMPGQNWYRWIDLGE